MIPHQIYISEIPPRLFGEPGGPGICRSKCLGVRTVGTKPHHEKKHQNLQFYLLITLIIVNDYIQINYTIHCDTIIYLGVSRIVSLQLEGL